MPPTEGYIRHERACLDVYTLIYVHAFYDNECICIHIYNEMNRYMYAYMYIYIYINRYARFP